MQQQPLQQQQQQQQQQQPASRSPGAGSSNDGAMQAAQLMQADLCAAWDLHAERGLEDLKDKQLREQVALLRASNDRISSKQTELIETKKDRQRLPLRF